MYICDINPYTALARKYRGSLETDNLPYAALERRIVPVGSPEAGTSPPAPTSLSNDYKDEVNKQK